jgi:L-asparaginase II
MTDLQPFPDAWRKAFTAEELERLAIRMMDGEMSAAEALVAERLSKKLWVERARAERARNED